MSKRNGLSYGFDPMMDRRGFMRALVGLVAATTCTTVVGTLSGCSHGESDEENLRRQLESESHVSYITASEDTADLSVCTGVVLLVDVDDRNNTRVIYRDDVVSNYAVADGWGVVTQPLHSGGQLFFCETDSEGTDDVPYRLVSINEDGSGWHRLSGTETAQCELSEGRLYFQLGGAICSVLADGSGSRTELSIPSNYDRARIRWTVSHGTVYLAGQSNYVDYPEGVAYESYDSEYTVAKLDNDGSLVELASFTTRALNGNVGWFYLEPVDDGIVYAFVDSGNSGIADDIEGLALIPQTSSLYHVTSSGDQTWLGSYQCDQVNYTGYEMGDLTGAGDCVYFVLYDLADTESATIMCTDLQSQPTEVYRYDGGVGGVGTNDAQANASIGEGLSLGIAVSEDGDGLFLEPISLSKVIPAVLAEEDGGSSTEGRQFEYSVYRTGTEGNDFEVMWTSEIDSYGG